MNRTQYSWSVFWIEFSVIFAIALTALIAAEVTLRIFARRHAFTSVLLARTRWPLRTTVLLAALAVATGYLPNAEWAAGVAHGARVLAIASGAWLVAAAFLVVIDVGIARSRLVTSETPEGRRIRTQVQVIRRLVLAVIVVVTVGAVLLTFDSVRAVGASLLASAGILSVVVGLAAQTLLANVFAGMQLAFSEAIRIGDVVVVEGNWGRIQQITLSYVVVVTWDRRTMVLPCTWFTTQVFENWTKLGTELSGTVELDLDWRASASALREQLTGILANTELWDGEDARVHMTDATSGVVRIRVLISAQDAPTLWALRTHVREELVNWVRDEHPEWITRRRVLLEHREIDRTRY